MKKTVVLMTLVILALAGSGCQQREQKGQGGYAGAPMQPGLPTPMELNQLQEATKMAPNNPQAWISLGNAMMDSKRYAEAVEAYQKGLALDPKNVNARVDMATCYRGLGQFDKAVGEFRSALKLDPNHAFGHRNLGVVLSFDLHNTAEGIKEFQKYLELTPNASDAGEIRKAIAELSAKK